MNGFIDRMPTWARDLGFMLFAVVLAWAGSNVVPVLEAQPGIVSTLGAPLLVLLIAAATKWTQAYGTGAGTARRPARRADEGRSRPSVALVVLAVLTLLFGTALLAGDASAAKHPTVKATVIPHVVARASACSGILTVNYDTEAAIRRGETPDLARLSNSAKHLFQGSTGARVAWTFLQSDGTAQVELHHVSGASGDGGRWDPAEAANVRFAIGGEVVMLVSGEPAYDLVRVTIDVAGIGRVASAGVLVTDGCDPTPDETEQS